MSKSYDENATIVGLRRERLWGAIWAAARVVVPFFVVCAGGALVSLSVQVSDARTEFTRRAANAARLQAQALAAPLARGDLAEARRAAELLFADSAVVSLEVVDARGEPVTRLERPEPASTASAADRLTGGTRAQQVEIQHQGSTVGTLRVTLFRDGATHGWRMSPTRLVGLVTGTPLLILLVAMTVARQQARRNQRLLEKVRTTATAVGEATTALREVSTSQSASAAQAAAALAETQAVASEVRSAAEADAARARQLAALAVRSETEASAAIGAVGQAREAVEAVHEQSRAIGTAIAGFSEQANAVGQIAASVALLAERSNVLALNAAIEASRAGQGGRAFSVVSREMRALAEATQRSAAQVKALISDVQDAVSGWTASASEGDQRVSTAVDRSRQALEAISAFGGTTEELARIGREVGEAGESQRGALEQTVEALTQANAAGDERLSGVKELEGSSGRLTEISAALARMLREDGERSAVRHPGAQHVRRTRVSALMLRIAPVALTFGIVCFGMGLFAVSMTPTVTWRARDASRERLPALTHALDAALGTGDAAAVATVLGAAMEQLGARYLVLRDASGARLAAAGPAAEARPAPREGEVEGELFALTVPIGARGAELSVGLPAEEAEASLRKSMNLIIGIFLFGFLAGTAIAYRVARRHAWEFEARLEDVDQAAKRMDEQIARLASATSQQTAMAAEASAALQETRAGALVAGESAAVRAEQATRLIDGGKRSAEDAAAATTAVTEAKEAIAALRAHVSRLSGAIAGFSSRAEEIGNVASAVSSLAERSDLLAVSASIEASRASGSAGFAVVAEEMRSLAEGSARAAQQVKEIVSRVGGALGRAQADAREGERRVQHAEVLADGATRRVAAFAEVAAAFAQVGHELGTSVAQQRTAIQQMVEAVSEAAEGGSVQAEGTRSVSEIAQNLVGLSYGLLQETAASASANAGDGGARSAA